MVQLPYRIDLLASEHFKASQSKPHLPTESSYNKPASTQNALHHPLHSGKGSLSAARRTPRSNASSPKERRQCARQMLRQKQDQCPLR